MPVPRAPTDKADVWKGEKFRGDEIQGEPENIKVVFYQQRLLTVLCTDACVGTKGGMGEKEDDCQYPALIFFTVHRTSKAEGCP